MRRVYVAGKLDDDSVDYIKNLHVMFVFAEQVRSLGFSVFIPGLDLLMGVVHGNWEYDDYFDNSQPWLEVSDAVAVIPGGSRESKGVQREIKKAKELGIPVLYGLGQLVAWEREMREKEAEG